MRTPFRIIMITIFFASIMSCGGSDDASPLSLIDPADASALSRVLITPSGSVLSGGNPPSPSSSNEAPTVRNIFNNLVSSNGATAPLNFVFDNVSGNLAGCYVQIAGADNFITVPYNGNASVSGDLVLPLGIPTNVLAGDFDVNFCVYDNDGLVSNVVTTSISVLRLGTGSLQISLSWDDSSDQDLYVTDPTGETISYTNTTSDSGGELDRDDTDGYGPENIFWTETAPDGNYSVRVDAYSYRTEPTTFYVTISTESDSRSFSGSTVNGNTVDVVTFVKNGNSLSF